MVELPDTIFVAAGVIAAALLTGVFSFVSLINQKEGKISEFRQNWIDALRNDIAQIVACLDRISSSWQLIDIEENKKDEPFRGTEWLNKFNQLIKNDWDTFSECYTRVLLRLNKDDDVELIDKLRQIKNMLSKTDLLIDKNIVGREMASVISLSQDLLKTEWGVVKAGEKPYIRTKRATFIITLLLLFGFMFLLFGYQKTLKETPNQPLKIDAQNARAS